MDAVGTVLQIVILLVVFFFLVSAVASTLGHRRRQSQRVRTIRLIERKRGSRVITLIHRQEHLSVFGIPLFRYIDVEDAEQMLQAIRLTPRETPIDLILHTPGGLTLPAQQIAYALKDHPSKVTMMVPHYAMSGGTLIALAADHIAMDRNAVLGAVDPQIRIGQQALPAASILAAVQMKDRHDLNDNTLILADVASKAVRQMREFVLYLLGDRLPTERASYVADLLTQGHWTHDYPLTVAILKQLGLPVEPEVPDEVYQLMRLYPQPAIGQPSVDYIPIPYPRRRGPDNDRVR